LGDCLSRLAAGSWARSTAAVPRPGRQPFTSASEWRPDLIHERSARNGKGKDPTQLISAASWGRLGPKRSGTCVLFFEWPDSHTFVRAISHSSSSEESAQESDENSLS